MSKQRLSVLKAEYDKLVEAQEVIDRTAADDGGRDLTDAEQADSDKLFDRMEQIKPEIEKLGKRVDAQNAVADVFKRVGAGPIIDRARPASPAADSPKVDLTRELAAQYLGAYFGAGSADEFVDRCAEWFDRDVADMISSDNAGILPVPIVGELIKFADSTRPVFSSMTGRPMPAAGKQFTRPRVTQRVNVAEQPTGELNELVSRKMTIVGETVTKRTFGGALDVSEQDIDWSDPSVWTIVLDDFVDFYAEVTEGVACDFLEALPATNTSAWDASSTEAVLTSLANGAVEVYGQCKKLPDRIWLSLDEWARWASMVDGEDRPLFPNLGAGVIDLTSGQFSGTPLGLKVTVGPQLAAETRTLGVTRLVEQYENRKGFLTAVKPSVLGREVAYYGYVAFYGRHEGFTELVEGS